MFSTKEKGITPVIAIVLLLLITVGAVGVVYTQFQQFTNSGEAQDELQNQQRLQSASYDIIGVRDTDNTDGGTGSFSVTIKNTGDVALDLSQVATLQIGKSGGSPQAVSTYPGGSSCGGSFGSLSPGQTATCDTGVSYISSASPDNTNDGQLEEVILLVDGVQKDSYTCDAGDKVC